MNWADGLALAMRFLGLYSVATHLQPGETQPYVVRTKIGGKMWRFTGEAGPEA